MQIVAIGDNLHEMSKLVFRGNKKNYFNLMSAETFTQSAKPYGELQMMWYYSQSSRQDTFSKPSNPNSFLISPWKHTVCHWYSAEARLTLVLLNKLRCHAFFQIFRLSDYLTQTADINSHAEWQTVQIQISWLLRSQLIWIYTVCKCRVYPGSAGQGLRGTSKEYPLHMFLLRNKNSIVWMWYPNIWSYEPLFLKQFKYCGDSFSIRWQNLSVSG